MKIRKLQPKDKPEIDKIYKEFYSDNEYPYFFYDCAGNTFVVTEDSGKIIVAGGLKNIAEAIFVTDKNLPPSVRLDALIQGLGSTISIARDMRHGQIHAFVNNDDKYVNTLKKFGFKLIDAKLLVLDFGESHG